MRAATTWREWSDADLRDSARAVAGRLPLLPDRWRLYVGIEHEKRGGSWDASANEWLLRVTAGAVGRIRLSANDADLRAAADKAAGDCRSMAEFAARRGVEVLLEMLGRQCVLYGVRPPRGEGMPAVRRLSCSRWWLRRLRRAHGRRAEGAAIAGGIVRRGLWPYASQDAVERRTEQRRRNTLAIERAVIECAQSGDVIPLTEVVNGSLANPENRRAELMVRIRGCDAIAADDGKGCEFWTLTAPSRFHARRVVGGKRTEENPNYAGASPADAQKYLCRVWARARAAWQRRGLAVFGLRTAEPHHDGCPHWHLIAYGASADLVKARELLEGHALRDSPDEVGARKHRFSFLVAKAGRGGAAYAAKYIAKNIDGGGMGKARDGEAGASVSESVRRVDAWASTWGIRQFQFFGGPSITCWRVLRRMAGPVGVAESMLERARRSADDGDFADFWRAWKRGGLELIKRASERLTEYGDAAAKRVVGVMEGARRALLPVKDWIIHWGGVGSVLGFDLTRSGAGNCTRTEMVRSDSALDRLVREQRPPADRFSDAVGALFAIDQGYGVLQS